MTRKRTAKNRPSKGINPKIVIVFVFIIIIIIAGVAITFYDFSNGNSNSSLENGTSDDNSTSANYKEGKWLFAMDTSNVQYNYGASGIPTLAIIDKNGDVVYYNQGLHDKSQLDPYIDSAIQGNGEIIAEAPDFTVTTFNDEEFILSEHKGEVIILDIMGVGCPPCELQMPELQKIVKERCNEITMISIDVYFSGESKEDVIDTYGEYIIR